MRKESSKDQVITAKWTGTKVPSHDGDFELGPSETNRQASSGKQERRKEQFKRKGLYSKRHKLLVLVFFLFVILGFRPKFMLGFSIDPRD